MVISFIQQQLKKARYKLLSDGTYFGEIRGIAGVWANAKNLEDCRAELQEVLEDWFVVSLYKRKVIKGFTIPKKDYA